MLKNSNYAAYSGKIDAKYKDADGQEFDAARDHNTVIYQGANILAKLLGGDNSFRPTHIGFVYAPNGSVFSDPGDARLQTLATLREAVESQGGNMLVSQLQLGKTYLTSGSTDLYDDNAVTFNGVSDPNTAPVFTGGGFTGDLPTAGAHSFYQVVLLADPRNGGIADMEAFAIAHLAAAGLAVQSGFELAVYWTVTFK